MEQQKAHEEAMVKAKLEMEENQEKLKKQFAEAMANNNIEHANELSAMKDACAESNRKMQAEYRSEINAMENKMSQQKADDDRRYNASQADIAGLKADLVKTQAEAEAAANNASNNNNSGGQYMIWPWWLVYGGDGYGY